jgi:hypothetical protein
MPTTAPTTAPTNTPTSVPRAAPSRSITPEEAAALANLVLLDDPGIGGDMEIVKIAARHYGEFLRPDGVPWSGWCEMFVGNVLGEAGVGHARYATALLDALSGPLYRGHAPAGSIVFFDQRSDPNGHVGIALGDGTMLSALGDGVVRSAYEGWPSYIGWRPIGTATAPPDPPFMVTPLLTPPEEDYPRMPAWP